MSTCLSFSCVFIIFGPFLDPLESLFGIFLEPLSSLLACCCHLFKCLWLAWAVCVLSLLLFVVPLARLGCLWARGPLRACFLVHFQHLFHVFSIVFSFASVVEAAPQARPKTTAVANTALRPSPCSPPSLNALPVPLLRQVSQNRCFTCMGALFWSNMGRHLQTQFWDNFWFHFGVIWELFWSRFGIAKRGRGRTTGTAEDHCSSQHSFETISPQRSIF